MRKVYSFDVESPGLFIKRLVAFSTKFSRASILSSNDWQGSGVDVLAAIDVIKEMEPASDSFQALKEFHEQNKDWAFGYLSYDLKNETEKLTSTNEDHLGFPVIHFFQPKYVFRVKNNLVEVLYLESACTENEIKDVVNKLLNYAPAPPALKPAQVQIQPRVEKGDYLQAIHSIKKHISYGDIYEMNYCMEFSSEQATINPSELFLKLNSVSLAPFSAYYKLGNKYLLCASPERFLKRSGNKITSQPIKGTARRGETTEEDKKLKEQLFQNHKDRSENVMIVDLVRNDLSKTCDRVSVEGLFTVYTFKQWHQMISSVTGEMREGMHFVEVIKNAFPMGSMTGAPKVKAMELIERYEKTKRGVYSGAVGYITPEGDFDFNVVIRSILYDASSNYLSFMVGSAITSYSIPENEYDECILKAKGIFEALEVSPLLQKEKEISVH